MTPPAPVRPIEWSDGTLVLLDQTRLPQDVEYLHIGRWQDAAEAIRTMVVRGAPAIGITAGYGLALAAGAVPDDASADEMIRRIEVAVEGLRQTRPTAVNLSWAVDRIVGMAKAEHKGGAVAIREVVLAEARAIHDEDLESCKRMGEFGADLLPDEGVVLTHCNAGALATAGWGTALGVIRSAVARGKRITVYADETRPRLQGMRLTAWELAHDGIPVTVITDSMAGWAMRRRKIDCVIVGADRIAANGDVANKIGTYTVAVLAKAHGIPFYVAAPLSTVDLSIASGEGVPIEERDVAEILAIAGTQLAPAGVDAWNPAFDVTPAPLIAAIITENGVARPPYERSLQELNR
jgi:methylthioribose-1-phosphate isomerase